MHIFYKIIRFGLTILRLEHAVAPKICGSVSWLGFVVVVLASAVDIAGRVGVGVVCLRSRGSDD